MKCEPVRLWLSGLPGTVSSSQISQRFESFGKVESVELIPEKIGTASANSPLQPCRGFAYVQLSPRDGASLRRCISMVFPFLRSLIFNIVNSPLCQCSSEWTWQAWKYLQLCTAMVAEDCPGLLPYVYFNGCVRRPVFCACCAAVSELCSADWILVCCSTTGAHGLAGPSAWSLQSRTTGSDWLHTRQTTWDTSLQQP